MQIFITRQLDSNSIFKKLLEDKGWHVSGKSLIQFRAIDFQAPEASDWLFFYSQKGVEFYFRKMGKQGFEGRKTAGIGKATALKIEELTGEKADFTGNGRPDATAEAFESFCSHQTVVFVQARHSKQSIQKTLKMPKKTINCVVYDNQPFTLSQAIVADILVFTSPMNVDSYFQQFPQQKAMQFIVIGQTTGNALKKWGVQQFIIASEPSEWGLAKAVSTIIG